MQRRTGLVMATVSALAVALGGLQAVLPEESPSLPANEAVQTITVRLDVASDGEALDEPLALDLGLGFPLWLHPVGRTEGEMLSFGAVPQSTTAANSIPPGGNATFTFAASGAAGQDQLLVTPQLLASVRISDLARVGFAGATTGNWRLKGYELQVNGQVLAANDAVNVQPKEALAAAQLHLSELGSRMAPAEEESLALQALVEAKLASPAEQQRLQEIETTLAPMRLERKRFEGVLSGKGPWFEDAKFSPRGRTQALVQSARVTILTDTHGGADTKNPIYFRVGGHKYLLREGAPESAGAAVPEGLSAPEIFELDLDAGPLTPADLRGYALGMLGSYERNGSTPDRWHPRSLIVEIDGVRVYDSDQSPVDRMSLDAIRIIPPAHLAQDGSVVVNTPHPRETFVWEAGSGAGIDLTAGGTEPVTGVEEPAVPKPEAGLEQVAVETPLETPFETEPGPNAESQFEPFPGECCGGGAGDAALAPSDSGFGPSDSAFGPGDMAGIDSKPHHWMPLFLWWLFKHHFQPDDSVVPIDPVEITDVRIASPWDPHAPYAVEWQVSGDESQVSHYEVQLLIVRPHETELVRPGEQAISSTAQPGARSQTLQIAQAFGEDDAGAYVMPQVTAIRQDPLLPIVASGPIRSVLPNGWEPFTALGAGSAFEYKTAGAGNWATQMLSNGSQPGRAAWLFPFGPAHRPITFDDPGPGYHLAVRPEAGDQVRVNFGIPLPQQVSPIHPVPPGRYKSVAHLGLLGAADQDSHIRVRSDSILMTWYTLAGEEKWTAFPLKLQPESVTLHTAAGTSPPMPLLALDFDTHALEAQIPNPQNAPVNVKGRFLIIQYILDDGAVVPDHPPALFGLRLLKQQ